MRVLWTDYSSCVRGSSSCLNYSPTAQETQSGVYCSLYKTCEWRLFRVLSHNGTVSFCIIRLAHCRFCRWCASEFPWRTAHSHVKFSLHKSPKLCLEKDARLLSCVHNGFKKRGPGSVLWDPRAEVFCLSQIPGRSIKATERLQPAPRGSGAIRQKPPGRVTYLF